MPELTALEIADKRWASFVEGSPEAVPFHRPEWSQLLADCYGYRAFTFSRVDAVGRISCGLPILEVKGPLGGRRWVSLPFTDYCPLLAGSEEEIDWLIDQVDAERRAQGVSRLEVRAPLPKKKDVHRHSTAVTHTLRLSPDVEAVFRSFKRKQVRQPILKAARDGVTVRRAECPGDLVDTFYELHVQTRARLGVPVQPRRYFRLLWQLLIEPGLAFSLLASVGRSTVAGAVFMAWNGTITYKYGASRPEFSKLSPNKLLLWTAIRWGCENGYRVFDFGRTDVENAGLRAFKLGWGTIEEPLVYSTMGDVPAGASTARLTALVRPVIRRMPPWVSRLVGELAYKYAR
jgi:CelD/BcsL family acetyltransferase involved in cellulose biosynthesis